MPIRTGKFGGPGHARRGDGRAWPVFVVLLAAALVPAGCVLWFMSAAMRNEELAMRQRVVDAYRQNLILVKDAVEADWAARQRAIDQAARLPAPETFGTLVNGEVADGAVVFDDDDGGVAYPADAAAATVEWEPDERWDQADELEAAGEYVRAAEAYARIAQGSEGLTSKAMALQAQARALVRGGVVKEAVVILRLLGGPEYREARDETGRLIGPAALLHALRVMPRQQREWGPLADQLSTRLEDYSGPAMSSAQRRLLMGELKDVAGTVLSALGGEELTAAHVKAIRPGRGGGLRRSGTGVLELRSADGCVVALYRPETVTGTVWPTIGQARVELLDPVAWGKAGEPVVSMPTGGVLQGWRLAVYESAGARAAGRGRAALYLWTGAAGVIVTAGIALAAGRYVSRQMAVTRLKNDLIATVSHELKTPVASTRMLVETLLEEPKELSGRVKEYLELIARENQRLSRLIENFLTFSRMERNKRAFEMAAVDLREVVRLAAEAVAERFGGPGCGLEVSTPEEPVVVRGDRDALVTAAVNLLDNAHKYTGERKEVGVTVLERGGEAVIEVRDNGIGLSGTAMRRVFDRFYQVDQTLSRKTGGCGLGLSIVKFIAEAHGGTVGVESRPGAGSRFTIRVPVMATVREETLNVGGR